jgi:hypothetical protein
MPFNELDNIPAVAFGGKRYTRDLPSSPRVSFSFSVIRMEKAVK